MKTFTDLGFNDWELQITIGAIIEVRRKYNIDLLLPEGTPGGCDSLADRVLKDPLLEFQIAVECCRDTVRSNSYDTLSEADLGNLFGGEEFKALVDAFYDEYTRFLVDIGRCGSGAVVLRLMTTKKEKQQEMFKEFLDEFKDRFGDRKGFPKTFDSDYKSIFGGDDDEDDDDDDGADTSRESAAVREIASLLDSLRKDEKKDADEDSDEDSDDETSSETGTDATLDWLEALSSTTKNAESSSSDDDDDDDDDDGDDDDDDGDDDDDDGDDDDDDDEDDDDDDEDDDDDDESISALDHLSALMAMMNAYEKAGQNDKELKSTDARPKNPNDGAAEGDADASNNRRNPSDDLNDLNGDDED